MSVGVVKLNNPDPPANANATIYDVKSGDCLWDIAMAQVLKEHPNLSGRDLLTATANELQLIEQANPQIVGPDGSGTYDLIFPNDKIAIPGGQSQPGSTPAATAQAGARGFNPPDLPIGTPPGVWSTSKLKAGQDILSADGKYDLVIQEDGNLVLYKLKTPYQRSENYSEDEVVWSSGTNGQPVTEAGRDGGNIILYGADGNPVKTISESSLPQNYFRVVVATPGGLQIGDPNQAS